MAGLTNNARPRDFHGGIAINGGDAERTSHATIPWGGSIWNSGKPVTSGFSSTVRDSSVPRDNGNYIGAPIESIQGKTGSGSLVASSESVGWDNGRIAWRASTAGLAFPRTGVSPARKRSLAQPEPSQQYPDNPTAFFPTSRPTAVGQTLVANATKPLLDPTSVNFTSARRIDPLNGLNTFGFGQSDAPHRSEVPIGPWPDAASMHSPTDDRRSVANSEYFPSSSTPSRSGSLPPSRHGNEPLQFGQPGDTYPRYGQPGQRQTSSFSIGNGRPYQGRSGSIQSEAPHLISQLSLDHDAELGTMSHRPSLTIHSFPPTFSPAGHDASLARENLADSQALERPGNIGYGQPGSYTPGGFTNGQVNDPNMQFRPVHFDSRSAPNGTGVHQSPYRTHSHTPSGFDHLYPSRSDHTLSTNSIALVNQRLANHNHNLQQQELRRNHVLPNQQMSPQQLQQIIAANQLRGYQYQQIPVPTAMGMNNNFPPNLPMPPVQGVIPIEPPRVPRGNSNPPELSTMSSTLYNFRNAAKLNKKPELKEILGYVVEFSGDQHGSRFIQQKLESANSDEKDKIFRELSEDCLQLMQDVFGNYVIQKFFEHGDQTQKKFLANRMMGHILELSNGMYGCRVVQKALEHVLTDQQVAIVRELEKDVLGCVRNCNGNHVIQKVIDRVPHEHIQNIIEAFRGQVGALATNTYGCRVIQRLLEKVPEPRRRFLLMELHAEGAKLISDQYGNYVTQHVVSKALEEDRAKVIALVKAQVHVFSKHKFASNVVERCLASGNIEQRREIMLAIIAPNERGENNLQTLIKDAYGNYVIQKLMETVSRPDWEEFVAILKPEFEKARKNTASKQIISIEKALHRFDHAPAPDTAASTAGEHNAPTSLEDAPPTPPLTSEAQSPQSSSLPSANVSTVDEPVHTSLANKNFSTPVGGVSIEDAS